MTGKREPAAEQRGRAGVFRPPSRRLFLALLGGAAATVMLRDRLSGREVVRNPATGRPIWIGHV